MHEKTSWLVDSHEEERRFAGHQTSHFEILRHVVQLGLPLDKEGHVSWGLRAAGGNCHDEVPVRE
jgi:hypothetical protein